MTAESRDRPAKEPEEIEAVYEDVAPKFARFEALDRLFTGRYRERLFSRADGRVLDVACGTGINFRYLPDGVELAGVDLSEAMLSAARDQATDLGLDVDLRRADAADLPYPDDSFDTVISSLSTCTFPEPIAVLREMDRVCRPDGRILLLEHGRSSLGPVARFQDWWAPRHFEKMGCRWNQEPADLVAEAGFDSFEVRKRFLGIITMLKVRPTTGRDDG
ncbi:Ubiquinone/menaquinone biosynthesis C-methylase UbiE [Halomicrobium zhouii]|uniref:Ubiquinone/menaquinone biosynthesis C-methylase UbiE n=1 Tax=Halomicrobium zhouii TaxID=767519 RepID=A0A1I6KM21_9EURY|nr:methyltransferase domain-containing protein [Halomicrobium zhouii]SFR92305.1 Ubiquinone/menaquinone biosynthesis C-methylase UbiE [Halomicrobium zhouii]